jgi:hypothetical protein
MGQKTISRRAIAHGSKEKPDASAGRLMFLNRS